MARPCPACGRPNDERREKCLYCLAALPSDAAASAAASPAVPPPAAAERFLLVLAPQEVVSDETVARFAAVLGLAAYEARVVLQTRRHRLLRKIEGRAAAEALSAALERAGVAHELVSEKSVDAVAIAPVKTVRLEDGCAALAVAPAGSVRIPYDDLMLLVRGEIARTRHRERQMATPRGASRPVTPGLRLHLYPLGDESLAAEIDAERCDWKGGPGRASASAAINLGRLVDELLRRAPQARLDRGFDWEPVVLSRAESVEPVDALFEGPSGREGVLHDNGAQFRFYARWRALVERRARGARTASGGAGA